MVKGLQASGGKWYYLDQDGKLSMDPVVLTPDQDGALRWIHSVHAPRPLDDVRPMASADWYV